MGKKVRHAKKGNRVPVLWRAGSWGFTILLGVLLFRVLLKRSGVSFPIPEGQSTDPYFFAALVSVAVPFLVQVYLGKILRGIVAKRSAVEIAKDVAKDLAVTSAEMAAGTVLDAVTGSDGKISRPGATGGDSGSGGGGSFGGGGASGSF